MEKTHEQSNYCLMSKISIHSQIFQLLKIINKMFNFLDISFRMYCFMNKLNIYFHSPVSLFVMMLQIYQKALKALLALLDLISPTVFYHLIIPVHKEWFLIPRILSHFLTVALRCFLSVEILFTGWQLILLKGTNK